MAAWYIENYGGFNTAALLGFDKDNLAQPFTSPDGRIRQITIFPTGGATVSLPYNANIFGDCIVHSDPNQQRGAIYDAKNKRNSKGQRLNDRGEPIKPYGNQKTDKNDITK